MEIVLASFAIFIGCFFATVSGFGFAMISTPMLSMVLSPKEAIIIIPLMTILLRIITMYQVRKEFDWRVVVWVGLGWFIGMFPGSYVLKIISMPRLQVFLGIVILAAVSVMGRKYYFELKNKSLGRFFIGIVAGFFGTATSVAGPPIVLYLLNERMEKDPMRANMIWIFAVGNTLTTLVNYYMGNARVLGNLELVAWLVPSVILAAYLGNLAFKYVPQELFRKLSLGIVCVGGVMMLLTGIRGL